MALKVVDEREIDERHKHRSSEGHCWKTYLG